MLAPPIHFEDVMLSWLGWLGWVCLLWKALMSLAVRNSLTVHTSSSRQSSDRTLRRCPRAETMTGINPIFFRPLIARIHNQNPLRPRLRRPRQFALVMCPRGSLLSVGRMINLDFHQHIHPPHLTNPRQWHPTCRTFSSTPSASAAKRPAVGRRSDRQERLYWTVGTSGPFALPPERGREREREREMQLRVTCE